MLYKPTPIENTACNSICLFCLISWLYGPSAGSTNVEVFASTKSEIFLILKIIEKDLKSCQINQRPVWLFHLSSLKLANAFFLYFQYPLMSWDGHKKVPLHNFQVFWSWLICIAGTVTVGSVIGAKKTLGKFVPLIPSVANLFPYARSWFAPYLQAQAMKLAISVGASLLRKAQTLWFG